MVLLDTDHISFLGRGNAEGIRLRRRLASLPIEEIHVSIVSFEEQTRGWLSIMAQAKTLPALVDAYAHLERHLEFYGSMPIAVFDGRAAEQLRKLQTPRLRIGTMDLRIASVALANNALLLSRNLRDFGRVPGLRVEDWTT